MIATLLSCLFEMIVIIAIGYFARKRNILTAEASNSLSKLLIQVLLPCSILASTSTAFDPSIGNDIKISILISFLYYTAGLSISFALFRLLPIMKDRKGIATTSTLFGNSGFIGYPLVQEMCGDVGFKLGLGFDLFFNPFMYTVGIRLFSAQKMGFRKLLKLILSPCLISVIISNVMYFAGWHFPSQLQSILSTVGRCTTAISMIVIGAGFVNADFKGLFTDAYAYLIILFKLIIYPLALFTLLTLFRASEQVKLVCVTMAALPVGSFNVILPKQYGGDVGFANRVLLLSMIFSLVTIPLIIFIVS